jgi:hypothetical protein
MPRLALLGLAAAAVIFMGSLRIRAGETGSLSRWDYRVLAKEQVLELGKQDLAAGLNHLGQQGWELAAVDGAYIFKRRRPNTSVEGLKQRLAQAENDLATFKERTAWVERMVRKGFLAESQLQAERARAQQAEAVLQQTRHDLDLLLAPAPKTAPPEKK